MNKTYIVFFLQKVMNKQTKLILYFLSHEQKQNFLVFWHMHGDGNQLTFWHMSMNKEMSVSFFLAHGNEQRNKFSVLFGTWQWKYLRSLLHMAMSFSKTLEKKATCFLPVSSSNIAFKNIFS